MAGSEEIHQGEPSVSHTQLVHSVNLLPKCMVVLITQSFLTLCNPMDCSPPGSSVHGVLQARILGVNCHSLLQRIFPTQGSNPGLLGYRQILYHLSYREDPIASV